MILKNSYSRIAEELFLENIFRKLQIGTYINILIDGLYDNTIPKQLYSYGWRGLNICDQFELIEKIIEERPEDINIYSSSEKKLFIINSGKKKQIDIRSRRINLKGRNSISIGALLSLLKEKRNVIDILFISKKTINNLVDTFQIEKIKPRCIIFFQNEKDNKHREDAVFEQIPISLSAYQKAYSSSRYECFIISNNKEYRSLFCLKQDFEDNANRMKTNENMEWQMDYFEIENRNLACQVDILRKEMEELRCKKNKLIQLLLSEKSNAVLLKSRLYEISMEFNKTSIEKNDALLEIAEKNKQIASLQNRFQSVSTSNQIGWSVANQRLSDLQIIYQSRGWHFLRIIKKIYSICFPPNSIRRKVYSILWKRSRPILKSVWKFSKMIWHAVKRKNVNERKFIYSANKKQLYYRIYIIISFLSDKVFLFHEFETMTYKAFPFIKKIMIMLRDEALSINTKYIDILSPTAREIYNQILLERRRVVKAI